MSSQRRVPLSFPKDEVSFNSEETRLGRDYRDFVKGEEMYE